MALVINTNGLVLHLRDDKPTIPHPGRWSLFEAVTSTPASAMVLNEGQAVREFTMTQARELPLAPFCRRALEKYAASFPSAPCMT
jgi:8-oxo-dGTP diphosphatase